MHIFRKILTQGNITCLSSVKACASWYEYSNKFYDTMQPGFITIDIYATTDTPLMNKHQGQLDVQNHKECVPIIFILQTGVHFPFFMSRLHIQ
jgi:hypothetical protein